MLTLRMSGINKCLEGVTTIDEVLRCTVSDEELSEPCQRKVGSQFDSYAKCDRDRLAIDREIPCARSHEPLGCADLGRSSTGDRGAIARRSRATDQFADL